MLQKLLLTACCCCFLGADFCSAGMETRYDPDFIKIGGKLMFLAREEGGICFIYEKEYAQTYDENHQYLDFMTPAFKEARFDDGSSLIDHGDGTCTLTLKGTGVIVRGTDKAPTPCGVRYKVGEDAAIRLDGDRLFFGTYVEIFSAVPPSAAENSSSSNAVTKGVVPAEGCPWVLPHGSDIWYIEGRGKPKLVRCHFGEVRESK